MSATCQFTTAETETLTVVELHYCQCCGKLLVLPARHKYCFKCGRNLLELDPIDIMIAEMVKEQENLLKRKYLREKLNQSVQ